MAVEMGNATAAALAAPAAPDVESVSKWLGESVPDAERDPVAEKLVRGGFVTKDASKWAAMQPEFLRESLDLTAAETVRVRHALVRARLTCSWACFGRLRDEGLLTLLMRLVTLAAIAAAIVLLYRELDDAQDAGESASTLANEALDASRALNKDLGAAQVRINATQADVEALNVDLLDRLANELPPLQASLSQLLEDLTNDTVAMLVLQLKELAESTDARLSETATNFTSALDAVGDVVSELGVSQTELSNNVTALDVRLVNATSAIDAAAFAPINGSRLISETIGAAALAEQSVQTRHLDDGAVTNPKLEFSPSKGFSDPGIAVVSFGGAASAGTSVSGNWLYAVSGDGQLFMSGIAIVDTTGSGLFSIRIGLPAAAEDYIARTNPGLTFTASHCRGVGVLDRTSTGLSPGLSATGSTFDDANVVQLDGHATGVANDAVVSMVVTCALCQSC